eukprot:sb/3465697/
MLVVWQGIHFWIFNLTIYNADPPIWITSHPHSFGDRSTSDQITYEDLIPLNQGSDHIKSEREKKSESEREREREGERGIVRGREREEREREREREREKESEREIKREITGTVTEVFSRFAIGTIAPVSTLILLYIMQIHPFGSHHTHIPLVVDRPTDRITSEDLIPSTKDQITLLGSDPSNPPPPRIRSHSPILRNIKVNLFRTTVEAILLYGAETWTLTSTLEKRLDGCYSRMLRMALGISWWDRVSNEEVFQNVPRASETVRTRRLRLAGHVHRHEELTAHQLLFWEPDRGSRSRGGARGKQPCVQDPEAAENGQSWEKVLHSRRIYYVRCVETFKDPFIALREDTGLSNDGDIQRLMEDRVLWRTELTARTMKPP